MKEIRAIFIGTGMCILLELIYVLFLNSSNRFGNAVMEFIVTLAISALGATIFRKFSNKSKNALATVAVFITNLFICCVGGNLLYFYFK